MSMCETSSRRENLSRPLVIISLGKDQTPSLVKSCQYSVPAIRAAASLVCNSDMVRASAIHKLHPEPRALCNLSVLQVSSKTDS